MKNNNFTKLVFCIFLLISGWVQAGTSFSNIYVFGDSLSDTGNLGSINGGIPAPYYNNRISNGPVAVETLAEKLAFNADASLHLIGPQMGTNYAVAGANASGDSLIDLPTQIISFQVNNGFIAPADALYVIFIGGNDVRDARDADSHEDALAIISDASTEVKNAIESLTLAGAKHFMLINSPNIAVIPETRLISEAADDKKIINRAKRYSKRYRNQLKHLSHALEKQYDIQITDFNLFHFFNQIIKKARKYGFTNNTDACFSSTTFTFHDDCNFGANADQFIFWDEIHPSARLHRIVGDTLFETITNKH